MMTSYVYQCLPHNPCLTSEDVNLLLMPHMWRPSVVYDNKVLDLILYEAIRRVGGEAL